MESVYVLWHTNQIDDSEEPKLIGVYRTEADAKSAIERLKGKPGFVDTPDGFMWDKYLLNEDHWTEGFIID